MCIYIYIYIYIDYAAQSFERPARRSGGGTAPFLSCSRFPRCATVPLLGVSCRACCDHGRGIFSIGLESGG